MPGCARLGRPRAAVPFYYGHDKKALSPAAQRGLNIFTNPKKANCEVCHTIGKTSALFTDNKFHNLSIGADTRGNLNDVGRFSQTKKDKDMSPSKRRPRAIWLIARPSCMMGAFPR